jgi:imidazolonepropionase-like amidohydrolase
VSAQRSENFRRELEATVGAVAQMRKRGIRVVPGGDYGFPYTPHGMYAFDLWVFTECFGYTNAEALSGATKLAGEVFRPGGEIGQVREGAFADLLLVDGDPTKDVRILQDQRKLAMIMKDGVMHKAAV